MSSSGQAASAVLLLMEVLTFSVEICTWGKAACVITGNPAVREKQGKAARQREQCHTLSDLPAEDALVGNSQAKEMAWEVPGRHLHGRKRMAKAGEKRWSEPVPEFLSLYLLPPALILVWAPQNCGGKRERGGGGPRESSEEPVH